MAILNFLSKPRSAPLPDDYICPDYIPPEEEKAKLFFFHKKWYNMDISNLSYRPDKERFDWNIRNQWIQQYTRSRNMIIFFAFEILSEYDILVPRWYYKPQCGGPLMVADTCLDMSHIPEHNLCVDVGMNCRDGFDYTKHGCWMDYVEKHMRIAMDNR